MRNPSDVKRSRGHNTDDFSDVINLSQIKSLDSVRLWSNDFKRKNILSDLSSDSEIRSSISNESDSVSAMTSSHSEVSDDSLDGAPPNKKTKSVYRGTSASVTPQKVPGGSVELDKKVDHMRKIMESISDTTKYLLAQSRFNVASILNESVHTFKELHATACKISSLDVNYRNSDQIEELSWNRLIETFKESYSELLSLITHMCKLMSQDITPNVALTLIELLPYVLDTLYCVLLSLLCHLEQNEAKGHLTSVFEKILNYSLVISCTYLDHSEEALNNIALLTIYRLMLTFVPLDLVYSAKDASQGGDGQSDPDLSQLLHYLTDEYMKQDFLPSTLLLFKPDAKYTPSVRTKFELDVVRLCASTLEHGLRSGVSRRQYPTSHIDPVGSFDLLVSSSFEDLWSRLNFWLLKILDSSSTQLRRLCLLILRHALCTIKFPERDAQFILSHVYNCLSDDDLITESLSILSSLSYLYPLKDGAVKRIVNLTLKGSRTNIRPKVFEFFSRCKYTPKGISFLISVYKSLSQSLVSGNQGTIAFDTNLNLDSTSEFNFTLKEWPLMVDSLFAIAKCNSEAARPDTMRYLSEEYPSCLKRRRFSSVTPSLWISFLWAYLVQSDDERSKVFKTLMFPEARKRFPRLVRFLTDGDLKAFNSYFNSRARFESFGELEDDSIVEFIKDPNNWKVYHEDNLHYSGLHLDQLVNVLKDKYVLDRDQTNLQKSDVRHKDGDCTCMDCNIDHILDEYNKYPGNQLGHINLVKLQQKQTKALEGASKLKDVFAYPRECNNYNETEDSCELEIVSHTLNPVCSFSGKTRPFVKSHLNQMLNLDLMVPPIDDVCSLQFPSAIGVDLAFKITVRSAEFPTNLALFYKLPKLIESKFRYQSNVNSASTESKTCNIIEKVGKDNKLPLLKPDFKVDSKDPCLFHANVTLNVNVPNQTAYPVRMDVYYCDLKTVKRLGFVWLHPKRSF